MVVHSNCYFYLSFELYYYAYKKKKIWNVLIMNHRIIFFKLLEIWKEKNKTTTTMQQNKNWSVD